MTKEEILKKFIEMKAEEFAKGRPKAPNIPQRTHELLCELASESFKAGFIEGLSSLDEINTMLSVIGMGDAGMN